MLTHIKIALLTFALSLSSFAWSAPSNFQNNTLSTLQESLEDTSLEYLHTNAGAITIIGDGVIRVLKIFYYADTACSNILGVASTVDNVTGLPFNSGKTIKLNASTAYTLGNNQGIAMENIACIRLYMDGGNQSSKGIDCQSFTDITCSDNTCTSNQSKTTDWVENPLTCHTREAYISNKHNKTVSKYAIDPADGTLSQCESTGSGFNQPAGISINNRYASIANQKANTVSLCIIDKKNWHTL